MKHIFSTSKYLLLAVTASAILTTSCMHEELSACYRFTLKAENFAGDDITESGDVAEASLYIFDEKYNHLETRPLDLAFLKSRQEIVLSYPEDTKLHIVAWGNAQQGNQIVNEADLIQDLRVKLKSNNGLADAPDELYYGNRLVQTKAGGGITKNDEIVIRPKISSVMVRTEGLKYVASKLRATPSADAFHSTVGTTPDAFGYDGTQVGDDVIYSPTFTLESNELKTPKHNMAAGQNLKVALDYNGKMLATTTVDENGDPLVAPEGQSLLVVFRFSSDGAFIGVRAMVRPWGYIEDNIEF
ncbi:MAG: FimB/Mfa2 family fimbrial subunit [Tannerellaceae bacterium]